jgi:hypothetical protein
MICVGIWWWFNLRHILHTEYLIIVKTAFVIISYGTNSCLCFMVFILYTSSVIFTEEVGSSCNGSDFLFKRFLVWFLIRARFRLGFCGFSAVPQSKLLETDQQLTFNLTKCDYPRISFSANYCCSSYWSSIFSCPLNFDELWLTAERNSQPLKPLESNLLH